MGLAESFKTKGVALLKVPLVLSFQGKNRKHLLSLHQTVIYLLLIFKKETRGCRVSKEVSIFTFPSMSGIHDLNLQGIGGAAHGKRNSAGDNYRISRLYRIYLLCTVDSVAEKLFSIALLQCKHGNDSP